MAIFNHDNISFYYEDDNNGARPLLFLHGLGGDTTQTLSVMKETPGIRRIFVDFRGHGNTIHFGQPEDFSFSQFSDDIISLMNYLKINRFIIGGISTGAGVALHTALKHPERIEKLILSRPAWIDKPQDEHVREAFYKIYKILDDASIEDKKEAYKQTTIYKEMNNLAHYAGSTLLSQFDYKYAKETSEKLDRIPNDCPNNNREEWKDISIPTLILASKQDPLHPYQYGKILNGYIKQSDFQEITPKEISGEKHNKDSYRAICQFLLGITP